MLKDVTKFGITSLNEYPSDRSSSNYYKQTIENDTLSIPYENPDIKCIDSISVHVDICDLKIIKTILGYKLIITAIKRYKIMYTAKNDIQSVHTTGFESIFCEFILFESWLKDNKILNIKDVFIGIEDIIIKSSDCRNIDISLILIIIPIICFSNIPMSTPKKNDNLCK